MTGNSAAHNSQTNRQVESMKALIFRGTSQIAIEAAPVPTPGFGEAILRVTLTTICGTDIHIVRGEYPVKPGLTIGHEAVGMIHELDPGVSGYEVGERVLVGAITPCGQCSFCLNGDASQCQRAARRLEIRKYNQWRSGGISACALRPGEYGENPC